MNKKEILNLSDTMLFVHILNLEEKMNKDIESKGKISNAKIKEYKTSLEEFVKRLDINLDVVIKERHMEHFWE
jgi:predicted enzyme involved in methoxymalonyl-ACP biosynthesis